MTDSCTFTRTPAVAGFVAGLCPVRPVAKTARIHNSLVAAGIAGLCFFLLSAHSTMGEPSSSRTHLTSSARTGVVKKNRTVSQTLEQISSYLCIGMVFPGQHAPADDLRNKDQACRMSL